MNPTSQKLKLTFWGLGPSEDREPQLPSAEPPGLFLPRGILLFCSQFLFPLQDLLLCYLACFLLKVSA